MHNTSLLGSLALWLLGSLISVPASAAFIGAYDVSNWTQSLNVGAINTSGAPNSVAITSSNDQSGTAADTDFTIAAVANGLVSFDWSYTTSDIDGPFFDPFGWLLNGVFTQVTDNVGLISQAGNVTFSVLSGDVFGFRAHSTDSRNGSATTTISNFQAPTSNSVPEPASLVLFGIGVAGFSNMRRRLNA